MEKAMKKTIVLFVLVIVIPVCLFADRWFTMNINYTLNRTCQLQFWTTSATSSLNGGTLDVSSSLGTNTAFARLGVVFTGTNIISVDLCYTPFYPLTLINGEKRITTTESYDYSLAVIPQGSNTSSWYDPSGSYTVSPETLEMSQYVANVSFSSKRIVSSKNPSQIGQSIDSSKTVLADLRIDSLDLGEGSGEYMSILLCYLTIE